VLISGTTGVLKTDVAAPSVVYSTLMTLICIILILQSQSYLVTTNSLITRAVESASMVVTRSTHTADIISHSLEGAYFEGSEGAEGLVDYQVHFSVSHHETGDTSPRKWEPELHELPSQALQAQLLHQV
jgi:hypothetical protein